MFLSRFSVLWLFVFSLEATDKKAAMRFIVIMELAAFVVFWMFLRHAQR